MATRTSNLVEFMQAGETLVANDAVYVDSTDGKIYKLDVNDENKNKFFGIAKDAGVLDEWIRVVQAGKARGFSGLTPGQPVYASTTVAGGFQLTEPSQTQLVTLGTAKSATELIVNAALSAKTGGAGSGLETGELIANAGFEEDDLSNVSCTNATVTRVASITGGANNEWALQITATAPTWFCDITGSGSEGTGFAKLQAKATVGSDAEFCILANGVEQACHESNILTSKSETFTIPTALNATENSIRIKGTSASNVVTADKASMKAGQLTTTGYYREEIITLVNSGANNISGTIRVQSDGQKVLLSFESLTHTSSGNLLTATGVIPSWAIPSQQQPNIYESITQIRRVAAYADGSIQFIYYDYAGGTQARTNTGIGSVTYPVAEAQTVQSFNSMVYGSDLLVSETAVQTVSTEATVTFGTIEEIHNGTFSSNVFTVNHSGYYQFDFETYLFRVNTDSAAHAIEAFFRINGSNISTPCIRTMRYDDTSLATSAESTTRSSISCTSKRFLTKGDQVSVRASAGQSVEISRKVFSVTRIMNPYGEPASLVIANEFVSGGVEQVVAGETWDGRQVYRRSFELTSTISTTGTVITTIPTDLEPIEVMRYGSNFYTLLSSGNGAQATNNNHSYITYSPTNGQITCFLIGANNCQVGTRFTMKYLKP
jgi:hypothetical protein